MIPEREMVADVMERMRVADVMERMRVAVPGGQSGDFRVGVEWVSGLEGQDIVAQLRNRPVVPGWYTVLREGNETWMSDTPPERVDQLEAAIEIAHRKGDVLIGGLGIGCTLRAAILSGASKVDVVELNQDVIRLVGPYYEAFGEQYGTVVNIIHDDLLAVELEGTWSVAWFDIWKGIRGYQDDREALLAKFGDRADWIGFWGEGREPLVW